MPHRKGPAAPRVDEAPPPASQDAVEQIGGYPVLRLIGEGASGRVYACKDPSLDRVVAVKVLHAGSARDPVRLERFRREARAMARISSPFVAALYQVGAHGGSPFLVLEHLEGEDLETRLKTRGRLPAREAVGYARDAALALEAASAAGILHRDVKPANLIVAEGRARLTDFGLARLLGDDSDLTREGIVAGSVDYLAPERVRGEPSDLRADIYSLGATLYALLAGRPPFVRPTPLDVITAHLDEEPEPLGSLRADVPGDVEAVIARMMAKQAERRFQRYDELVLELERLLLPPAGQLRLGEEGAFADEPTESFEAEPTEAYDIPAPLDVPAPLNDFAPPPGLLSLEEPSAGNGSGAGSSLEDADAHMPQPTGVLGNLKQMSLAEIAQMLELGQKTARVELIPVGVEPGEVCFDRGRLVYASAGRVYGADAFYALAASREGFFRIHYDRAPEEINVDVPLGFLMLEAMRRIDEGRASAPEAADPALEETNEYGRASRVRDTGELAAVPHTSAEAHDTLPEGAIVSASDGAALVGAEPVGARASSGGSRESFPEATLIGPPPRSGEGSDERAWEERSASSSSPGRVRSVSRRDWRSPFYDVSDWAARLVASPRSRRALEEIRRRPALFAGLAAAPAALLAVVLVVGAGGTSDEALLARIDAGEATQVLLELSQTPEIDREPREELLRGHALARLDRPAEAVLAYRAAARGGAVDPRALELVLSRLDHEEPSAELDALIDWPGDEVEQRLHALVKDQRWWVRQNALLVLEGRGDAEAVDKEAFAIQDLLTGPSCLERRKGLLALRAVGKSERAREALKEAARRGGENLCMERELREMMPQVKLR